VSDSLLIRQLKASVAAAEKRLQDARGIVQEWKDTIRQRKQLLRKFQSSAKSRRNGCGSKPGKS